MPTILLIRHSRPDFDIRKPVRGDKLVQAVEGYDAACLATIPEPHKKLKISAVHASNKQRSIQSASALFPSATILSSELYREAELPLKLPRWPTLPFSSWLVFVRCAWFLGYSQDAENLTQARSRAADAASNLIAFANTNGQAVLVGHGIFNRLIGSRLREFGWKNLSHNGSGYDSWQMYQA